MNARSLLIGATLYTLVSVLMAVPLAGDGIAAQAPSDSELVPVAEEATDGTRGFYGAAPETLGEPGIGMQAVELASYIAVIVASVVAILGVSAWRREFRGKRDIELTEDVLCLFYRAERAIEAIRCPVSYSSEAQTRVPEPRERSEQKKARDQAHVVFIRIRDHGEVFDQLYALRFRFMARLGRHSAKPFDNMRDIIIEIRVSAGSLAQLWAEQLRRGDNTNQGTEQQIKKCEAVIWSTGVEDQIGPRVTKIIEETETICRPIIEGRGSWFSQFWKKVVGERAAQS